MDTAAEDHLEEPTIFEEVSVTLVEEQELSLDPYLFALSGNSIQQYCTLLSWLELKNPKPEIYFETEQGVTMPLSLARIDEEFEILPCLSQAGRTLQTSEPESLQQETAAVPLVRLQYNFVPELERGVLQGKPSVGRTVSEIQQETDLQTRSEEPVSSGKIPCTPPEAPRYHPSWEGLAGHLNATLLQQEDSRQPGAACFATATALQGSERSKAGLNLLLRKGGHCCGGAAEETTIHPGKGTSELRSNAREGAKEPLSFQIRKGACVEMGPFLGPSSGGKPTLNPVAPQLVPPQESNKHFNGRPPVSFSAASLTGHPKIFAGERQKLSSQQSLEPFPRPEGYVVEKLFRCPDCGRGFVHRSSIRRHQKLQRKESPSPNPEQERRCGLGALPHQKSHWGKKPLGGPGSGMGLAKEKSRASCTQLSSPALGVQKYQAAAKKPFRCSECGKRFTEKCSMIRHEWLHQSERPFECFYCNKSYTQKCHLKRHQQQKHTTISQ